MRKRGASWEHPAKDARPACGVGELLYKVVSQLRVKGHDSDTSTMTELAPLVLCILRATRNHPRCDQGMGLAVSKGSAWVLRWPSTGSTWSPPALSPQPVSLVPLLMTIAVTDRYFLRPPFSLCATPAPGYPRLLCMTMYTDLERWGSKSLKNKTNCFAPKKLSLPRSYWFNPLSRSQLGKTTEAPKPVSSSLKTPQ